MGRPARGVASVGAVLAAVELTCVLSDFVVSMRCHCGLVVLGRASLVESELRSDLDGWTQKDIQRVRQKERRRETSQKFPWSARPPDLHP